MTYIEIGIGNATGTNLPRIFVWIFVCHYLFSESWSVSHRSQKWNKYTHTRTGMPHFKRMGSLADMKTHGKRIRKRTHSFRIGKISYLPMFDQMAHLFLCLKIYVHALAQQYHRITTAWRMSARALQYEKNMSFIEQRNTEMILPFCTVHHAQCIPTKYTAFISTASVSLVVHILRLYHLHSATFVGIIVMEYRMEHISRLIFFFRWQSLPFQWHTHTHTFQYRWLFVMWLPA